MAGKTTVERLNRRTARRTALSDGVSQADLLPHQDGLDLCCCFAIHVKEISWRRQGPANRRATHGTKWRSNQQ